MELGTCLIYHANTVHWIKSPNEDAIYKNKIEVHSITGCTRTYHLKSQLKSHI